MHWYWKTINKKNWNNHAQIISTNKLCCLLFYLANRLWFDSTMGDTTCIQASLYNLFPTLETWKSLKNRRRTCPHAAKSSIPPCSLSCPQFQNCPTNLLLDQAHPCIASYHCQTTSMHTSVTSAEGVRVDIADANSSSSVSSSLSRLASSRLEISLSPWSSYFLSIKLYCSWSSIVPNADGRSDARLLTEEASSPSPMEEASDPLA